jgi:hypothetical protein
VGTEPPDIIVYNILKVGVVVVQGVFMTTASCTAVDLDAEEIRYTYIIAIHKGSGVQAVCKLGTGMLYSLIIFCQWHLAGCCLECAGVQQVLQIGDRHAAQLHYGGEVVTGRYFHRKAVLSTPDQLG